MHTVRLLSNESYRRIRHLASIQTKTLLGFSTVKSRARADPSVRWIFSVPTDKSGPGAVQGSVWFTKGFMSDHGFAPMAKNYALNHQRRRRDFTLEENALHEIIRGGFWTGFARFAG